MFARGLKIAARPAPDLPGQVAARLREAALGRLGLARKAGVVVTGFAKTEAALGGGALAALIVAADAAEDGRRKMLQALRRGGARHRRLPILRLFSEAELSLAMGRPNVIHAAVLQSPAGRSFVDAALRLQRYEGVRDGVTTDNAAEPQDMANE